MKVKCDFCGGMIEDTEQICPNCGAVNSHTSRVTDGIPKTIDELRAFCESKKLPLEQMRFFIGEDYRGAKAFGIFRDSDGNYVVYKNKADGTRAERYRGPDEAHAVNEIYEKMKSEVAIRRNKNSGSSYSSSGNQPKKGIKPLLKKLAYPVTLVAVVGGIIGLSTFWAAKTPNRGYYRYNDRYYYCQGGSDWYYFDPISEIWLFSDSIDSELYDNYSDYYADSDYDSDFGVTDFSDTDYYVSPDNNSDWNDGNDWDFGGNWDAGDTDWDTDW